MVIDTEDAVAADRFPAVSIARAPSYPSSSARTSCVDSPSIVSELVEDK